jgi:alpha-L-fucosidase
VSGLTGRAVFPVPLDPQAVAGRRRQLLETADETIARGPFAPTWASLAGYHPPDWYLDAKFGIFIHWLAASVPAYGTEWYPRTMYLDGTPEYRHHRQVYGDQAVAGFKDFLPQFTAASFDAAEWMALIRRAGARYVVPVAEHHDGYHLGQTGLSRWSATRVGPHRDLLGELKAAAAAEGLHFGLSCLRAEHWWFFNGGTRFGSDVRDPRWADLYGPAEPKNTQPDQAFLDDWLARTVELVERYDPELVWFDWWIEEPAFEPYRRTFAAYFYNHAAAAGHGAVINYKWDAFEPGTAVYDIERGGTRGISARPFQNDSSTSRRAWAYLTENDYKTADEIVIDLVDAVSKNGVLLLNIGPRPDGTIDPIECRLLEQIGQWMATNGEAIYGTRPWLVPGEGPSIPPAGSFTDTAPPAFTLEDIRFTTRDDTLYGAVLNLRPDATEVRIRSLATTLRLFDGEVAAVHLLGVGSGLPFRRDASGLTVSLPARPARPGPSAVGVLRIDLRPAGPPPRAESAIID